MHINKSVSLTLANTEWRLLNLIISRMCSPSQLLALNDVIQGQGNLPHYSNAVKYGDME